MAGRVDDPRDVDPFAARIDGDAEHPVDAAAGERFAQRRRPVEARETPLRSVSGGLAAVQHNRQSRACLAPVLERLIIFGGQFGMRAAVRRPCSCRRWVSGWPRTWAR